MIISGEIGGGGGGSAGYVNALQHVETKCVVRVYTVEGRSAFGVRRH